MTWHAVVTGTGAEARPDLKTSLRLGQPSEFAYTSQSGVDRIEGVSDETDYEVSREEEERQG